MALFKAVVWALIFLTKLRFPPGVSIAIVLKEFSRHFMYKKGRVNSNSRIISTDEDPSLRIESSAIINLRGVSTKLKKYIVFTMQTYKKLNFQYIGF